MIRNAGGYCLSGLGRLKLNSVKVSQSETRQNAFSVEELRSAPCSDLDALEREFTRRSRGFFMKRYRRRFMMFSSRRAESLPVLWDPQREWAPAAVLKIFKRLAYPALIADNKFLEKPPAH